MTAVSWLHGGMMVVRLVLLRLASLACLHHSLPTHCSSFLGLFQAQGSTAFALCALDSGSCVLRGT